MDHHRASFTEAWSPADASRASPSSPLHHRANPIAPANVRSMKCTVPAARCCKTRWLVLELGLVEPRRAIPFGAPTTAITRGVTWRRCQRRVEGRAAGATGCWRAAARRQPVHSVAQKGCSRCSSVVLRGGPDLKKLRLECLASTPPSPALGSSMVRYHPGRRQRFCGRMLESCPQFARDGLPACRRFEERCAHARSAVVTYGPFPGPTRSSLPDRP